MFPSTIFRMVLVAWMTLFPMVQGVSDMNFLAAWTSLLVWVSWCMGLELSAFMFCMLPIMVRFEKVVIPWDILRPKFTTMVTVSSTIVMSNVMETMVTCLTILGPPLGACRVAWWVTKKVRPMVVQPVGKPT